MTKKNTRSSFPSRVIFNKSHMHDECMEYWVAMVRVEYLTNGVRQRTMVAQNCFKAQPFWMWKNKHSLKHLTLRQMMIPGEFSLLLTWGGVLFAADNRLRPFLLRPNENMSAAPFWKSLFTFSNFVQVHTILACTRSTTREPCV